MLVSRPQSMIANRLPPRHMTISKEVALADDVSKLRAEAQFRKAQQAKDGKAAMAEYEANAAAVRANTERLRALRLAREAAAENAAPTAAPR